MKLPTLYKKSSGGAMLQWDIEVDEASSTIITTYGQIGGKLQTTSDTIREGKNQGRSNETSPLEQAKSEAQSRWEKQLKAKKYVQTKYEAKNGLTDERVLGGIDVMLAHTFEKQGHKIVYPCYGQPKLDGTRCIAVVEDGVCTLWTRTRKPITSMPHIVDALEKEYPLGNIILDGELYAHHLNNDFEEIIHFVRQENAAEGHEAIQYWVYDIVSSEYEPLVNSKTPFSVRTKILADRIPESPYIVLVPTFQINNPPAIETYHAECVQTGFEGCMVRNAHGLYVNKRSYDLLKVKSFLDGEFEIIGFEEGRGKLTNSVGAFVCKTDKGIEFKAKLKGSLDRLKDHWKNQKKLLGKMMTVKFQGWTADGSLRFPVGVAIRDYE